MESKRRLFRSIEALAHLNGSDLDQLASVADLVTLEPGEHIQRQGQRATHCFVIASGRAQPASAARMLDFDHLATQAGWNLVPTTIIAATRTTVMIIDRRRWEDVAQRVVKAAPSRATQMTTVNAPAPQHPRLA